MGYVDFAGDVCEVVGLAKGEVDVVMDGVECDVAGVFFFVVETPVVEFGLVGCAAIEVGLEYLHQHKVGVDGIL